MFSIDRKWEIDVLRKNQHYLMINFTFELYFFFSVTFLIFLYCGFLIKHFGFFV